MRLLSSLSPVVRPGRPGLILFPLIWALLFSPGCGGKVYLVTSLAPTRAIVIDGDASDWAGVLSYAAKDQSFVGFVNDRENLSICLSREERGGPQAGQTGGWTVWFDPAGGTQKTYGLRIAPPGGPQGEEPKEGVPADQAEQASPAEPALALEWIGPDGNVLRRLTADEAARLGLEVREGRAGGSFVLEIKIPLETSASRPIAVGTSPDGVIGVGFFSNRAERNGGPGARPGGMTAGTGQPGGGGGMQGGRTGGAGGPEGGWRGAMEPNLDPDIAKGVKIWTRVRLRPSDAPGRSDLLEIISY